MTMNRIKRRLLKTANNAYDILTFYDEFGNEWQKACQLAKNSFQEIEKNKKILEENPIFLKIKPSGLYHYFRAQIDNLKEELIIPEEITNNSNCYNAVYQINRWAENLAESMKELYDLINQKKPEYEFGPSKDERSMGQQVLNFE